MSTITSAPPVTPQELLAMADSIDFELVDGKLVERNMGMESSEIAMKIGVLLGIFLRQHFLGKLFGSDAGYQCFADAPSKIRKPDVSFIRSGRLPGDHTPAGYCPIAPDLAVEVTSTGDQAYEVEEKIAEYLKAGVPLVWVIHPPTRTVRIHRPRSPAHSSVSELADGDTTGEEVLPGFSCSAGEFFNVR